MHESIVVRARCRRKESSRSLSHLLMSFLYNNIIVQIIHFAETRHVDSEMDKLGIVKNAGLD